MCVNIGGHGCNGLGLGVCVLVMDEGVWGWVYESVWAHG